MNTLDLTRIGSLLMLILSAPQALAGGSSQANAVSQYGVTWQFAVDRPVGQFANGDWWVLGPVEITAMTPAYDGARNGWQVNPAAGPNPQGFDDRIQVTFDAALVPPLPYTAQAGESILKSISGDGRCYPDDDPSTHPCFLDVVAVLTVLDEIPPGNGAEVFRPSFMAGTARTLYRVADLHTELLPSLPAVADAPDLAFVENQFKRLQLDYTSQYTGRYLHPAQNMSQYGSDIAVDTNLGGLRLMLDDPLNDKMPALIAYVQAGIDFYHMLDAGATWRPNGGHFVGRKLPLVFAAVLLDDADMRAAIAAHALNTFSEDGHTYYTPNGLALWGQDKSESDYWRRITQNVGSRDIRDPYGYVDGGGSEIGAAYQLCCTSQPYKGAALGALLLPGGKTLWGNNAFFDYVDRWVEFGVWASPDPCTLQDPVVYTGVCVPGGGRWTALHGTRADQGDYRHPFVDAMWAAYRDSVPTDDLIFAHGFD